MLTKTLRRGLGVITAASLLAGVASCTRPNSATVLGAPRAVEPAAPSTPAAPQTPDLHPRPTPARPSESVEDRDRSHPSRWRKKLKAKYATGVPVIHNASIA